MLTGLMLSVLIHTAIQKVFSSHSNTSTILNTMSYNIHNRNLLQDKQMPARFPRLVSFYHFPYFHMLLKMLVKLVKKEQCSCSIKVKPTFDIPK